MPQYREKRNLPFRPERLFDLVADIERYPEFLPWCKAARVLKREGDILTADLIIGTKILNEKFTSIVTLDRPHRIGVSYVAGPLSHLTNEWEFKPRGKSDCDLCFHVDFDFKSKLLAATMSLFFDQAMLRMAAAFETRAYALYGR